MAEEDDQFLGDVMEGSLAEEDSLRYQATKFTNIRIPL